MACLEFQQQQNHQQPIQFQCTHSGTPTACLESNPMKSSNFSNTISRSIISRSIISSSPSNSNTLTQAHLWRASSFSSSKINSSPSNSNALTQAHLLRASDSMKSSHLHSIPFKFLQFILGTPSACRVSNSARFSQHTILAKKYRQSHISALKFILSTPAACRVPNSARFP